MSEVVIIHCDNYEYDKVKSAINRGLEYLGGVQRFARADERILLKPNLLAADPPERCVTTHPAVFAAVAEAFIQHGVYLTYGDSPGFGSLSKAARKSGLAGVAGDLSIEAGNFEVGERITFAAGKQNKSFVIAQAAARAEGIISLPKLKSHALTTLTGAIKNQFGCIPGFLKGEYHAKLTDMKQFVTMLVDLNRCLKPRLYVMDAIMAMEGNGPRNGRPRRIGALLFSSDPVAIDATAARMVGLVPDSLEMIRIGQELGLGRMDKEAITLLGDALAPLVITDFELAHSRNIARLAKHRLRHAIVERPRIKEEKCIRCGICIQVCPVTPKALQWVGGDASVNPPDKPPCYDYDRCIRCYCCQELCPEGAIMVHTPIIGQVLNCLKPPVS
ncbi:MAG: DUF362 domain-containing protein [Syntrophomonadaceae bacterium]|jgi:uncharacterized protein (DUF362 family)